jgi:hypothetical protein
MSTAILPTFGKVNLQEEAAGLHIMSLAKPWEQPKE